MSDKQKKVALGVAIVLLVAFVGQWLGYWEMSLPLMPTEGPDASSQ